jgi:TolA-binding protein
MHQVGRLLVSLPLWSFLLLWPTGQAQTPGAPASRAPRIAQENTTRADQTNSAEIAELKTDIRNMQSVVNQMQANFALVGNPTTPVNHILELNIDMWRMVLDQMQRRAKLLEERNSSPSKPQK